MVQKRKATRVAMWVLLAVLMSALVYAGAELFGQANKTAADAGSTGSEMEMATLDSVKPAKSKPVQVSQLQRLKNKLNAADKAYKVQADKARSESVANQHVSEATRNAGMAAANKYSAACDELAAYYAKSGNEKQAEIYRMAGPARIKNAEMTFNDADASRISAYNDAMDKLNKARDDYFGTAKEDLSDADRAEIKASLTPRIQKLQGDVSNLLSQVTSLLSQVKSAAGGDVTAITGCARQVATGAADGPSGLLSPVMGLMNLVKGMGSNLTSMMSAVSAL